MKRNRVEFPISINGLEFDAMLSADEEHTVKVPTYPTEKGFVVADSAYHEPMKLAYTLFASYTPIVVGDWATDGDERVYELCDALRYLMLNAELCTVITTEDMYTNMIITSLRFPRKPETGKAREIQVELTEVVVTETDTETVSASYSRSGASKSSGGSAQAEKQEANDKDKDDDSTGGDEESYSAYCKMFSPKYYEEKGYNTLDIFGDLK